MTDKEIIQSAYEDAIKACFSALLVSYTSADTATKKKNAEKRFVTGVEIARAVKAKAIEILP